MELLIMDGSTQDQVEYQLDQCNNSIMGVLEHQQSARNSMATSVVRFRRVYNTFSVVQIKLSI